MYGWVGATMKLGTELCNSGVNVCTRRVYCIIPVKLTDKNSPKLIFISFIHLHYLKFESRLVVAGKNIDKC